MSISSLHTIVRDAFHLGRLHLNGTIVHDLDGRELALSSSGTVAFNSICKDERSALDTIEESTLVQLLGFYFFDQGSLSRDIDYASLLQNQAGLIQPSKVSFEITKACTMNCMHCYNDSGKRDAAEIANNEKLAITDYLGRWGVRFLHLTGGEPVIDPCLPDVLSIAGKYGMSVIITTNGWTLSDAVLAAIDDGTVVHLNISLDGIDAETHDLFRRSKDSFARVLRSIEILGRHRPRILQLNVCVHTTSLAQMEALGSFAVESGFDSISFKPVTFSGRSEVGQDFLLSLEDLRLFRKMRVRLRNLYKGRLHVDAPILDTKIDASVLDETECDATDRSMLILADGKMTPCASLNAGSFAPNFREQLPICTWLSHPLFVQFRSIKNEISRSNRGCPGERFTLHTVASHELAQGACHG
jgi:MoaA/NifB/PqqE/SkfB family radical SAM enzyme